MTLTLPRRSTGTKSRPLKQLTLFATAILAMVRTLKNRRAALHLADLPDHLLHDVGLKRDDVHAALQTTWRTDPTYLLALCASERRCGR